MTNTRDPQYTARWRRGPPSWRYGGGARTRRWPPSRPASRGSTTAGTPRRSSGSEFARRRTRARRRPASGSSRMWRRPASAWPSAAPAHDRSPVLDAYAATCTAEATRLRGGRTRRVRYGRRALGARPPSAPGRLLPLPRGRGAARAAPPAQGRARAGARLHRRRRAARPAVAGGDRAARPARRIELTAAAEPDEPAAPSGLTARELEVLALVARGLTNRDVGRALFVTERRPAPTCPTSCPSCRSAAASRPPRAAHRLGLVLPSPAVGWRSRPGVRTYGGIVKASRRTPRGWACAVTLVAAACRALRRTGGERSCASPANEIEAENCRPGSPASVWDVTGAGSDAIQGFATDISVDQGWTVALQGGAPPPPRPSTSTAWASTAATARARWRRSAERPLPQTSRPASTRLRRA